MKKPILLLFAWCLLATITKAQTIPTGPKTHSDSLMYEAGNQMQIASAHFYTGLIIPAVAGVFYFTITVDKKAENFVIGNVLLIAGSVIGTIFLVESYSHIDKAGRMLRNELRVKASPTYLGLSYSF